MPGQPGALARGMQISWGKGMGFGARGLQPRRNTNLQLEMVKWEGVVGAGFSSGGGAWHGGCCSKMGPGGLQGRGSWERRQADSLGIPFNPVGLCPPRHTRAPALVRSDEASWGVRASLSDAVEHQPTQGPGNYRGRVAA